MLIDEDISVKIAAYDVGKFDHVFTDPEEAKRHVLHSILQIEDEAAVAAD